MGIFGVFRGCLHTRAVISGVLSAILCSLFSEIDTEATPAVPKVCFLSTWTVVSFCPSSSFPAFLDVRDSTLGRNITIRFGSVSIRFATPRTQIPQFPQRDTFPTASLLCLCQTCLLFTLSRGCTHAHRFKYVLWVFTAFLLFGRLLMCPFMPKVANGYFLSTDDTQTRKRKRQASIANASAKCTSEIFLASHDGV